MMACKFTVLCICGITAATVAASNLTTSSSHIKWRLTDESSCTIETASPLPSHTLLHLTVGRRVDEIKDIRVQANGSDMPLEVWTKAGPHDSRSVVADNTSGLRIEINLLRQEKRAPVLKPDPPDTAVLICGKTRLTVRTSQ